MKSNDNIQLNNRSNYRGLVLRDVVSCEYLLEGEERKYVLNGVNIEIAKNEVIGISGRTRLELSVLTEVLANMRAYYQGTAILSSRGTQRKKKRIVDEIFYIDCPNMLQGSMLVLEQMMFATTKSNLSALKKQKYIMDLLVSVGMKQFILQKIDTLSYNQRLIVAILIGLLSDSEITIANLIDQQFSIEEIMLLKNVADYAQSQSKALVVATMQPNLIGMALQNVAYVINGKIICHESVEQLCGRLDKVSYVIKGTDYDSMKNCIDTNMVDVNCYISDNLLIVSCNPDDVKASAIHELFDKNGINCDYIKINNGRVINSFEELVKNYDIQ